MIHDKGKLVFYFQIDCALCRSKIAVSHAVIHQQAGDLVCTMCGKIVKVPRFEGLVEAAEALNLYLGDPLNAQYMQLVLNPIFKAADTAPAAH